MGNNVTLAWGNYSCLSLSQMKAFEGASQGLCYCLEKFYPPFSLFLIFERLSLLSVLVLKIYMPFSATSFTFVFKVQGFLYTQCIVSNSTAFSCINVGFLNEQ